MVFDRLRKKGEKALIPYITPEYPFREITLPLMSELGEAGADLLEVGIPFSDPLADGPTIQQSSETGLRNGATISLVLDAVKHFRLKHETPVLLMGYVNPVFRFGLETFLLKAVEAGVDGLILPDVPPEEASSLKEKSEERGISNVFLIAPTTTPQRMHLIDQWSTHLSYCVSLRGVTGARSQLGTNGSLENFLASVRQHTTKPFVVGFGISTPDQVRRVCQTADGAVVGSALLNTMHGTTDVKQAIEAAVKFFRSLR